MVVKQLPPISETVQEPAVVVSPPPRPRKSLTRRNLSAVVLIILAALGLLASILIAAPLVPALTWALSMAIVAYPLHQWLAARIRSRNITAGLTVAIIAAGLVAPAIFIGHQAVRQLESGLKDLEQQYRSGEVEAVLKKSPQLGGVADWAKNNINPEQVLDELKNFIRQRLGGWITATIEALIQILIALFVLFFLLRDRQQAVTLLRSMLPLSDRESDGVLEQVRGTVHATIYGTFFVAAVQGTLGGLMFWLLGVPAPLVWGTAMAILSLVPTLGAFVICLPAAIFLGIQGHWAKAVMLAAWGVLAVGSVDNILHPIVVGKQMRMHTVPVFIATVGGLFLLGAPGIVLGPVAFAMTLALLQVLRRRTVRDRSAKEPT
jgi:predicted PurR-regulated permease PerM